MLFASGRAATYAMWRYANILIKYALLSVLSYHPHPTHAIYPPQSHPLTLSSSTLRYHYTIRTNGRRYLSLCSIQVMSSFRRTVKKTAPETASSSTSSHPATVTTTSPSSSSSSSSSTSLVGAKPWINSQALVSTGLRQLDDIVGGGLVLGSVTLVEEDEMFGSYAECLLGYRSLHLLLHYFISPYLTLLLIYSLIHSFV